MALRLCCLLLIAALAGFGQAPASNQDAIIHDQVILALAADRDVRGNGYEVLVKEGVVTLRGRARDKKAKEKAAKVAKKVKGVTSVDNQLKLPDEK